MDALTHTFIYLILSRCNFIIFHSLHRIGLHCETMCVYVCYRPFIHSFFYTRVMLMIFGAIGRIRRLIYISAWTRATHVCINKFQICTRTPNIFANMRFMYTHLLTHTCLTTSNGISMRWIEMEIGHSLCYLNCWLSKGIWKYLKGVCPHCQFFYPLPRSFSLDHFSLLRLFNRQIYICIE